MTAILCPTWSKLSQGDVQLHRNILNKRLWCKPHSQFRRQTNMRTIGLDGQPARHGALKTSWCSGGWKLPISSEEITSWCGLANRVCGYKDLLSLQGEVLTGIQKQLQSSWVWLGAGSSVPGPDAAPSSCHSPPVYVLFCYLPQRPRAEGKANLDTKIKYSSRLDSLLCTCKQPLECHAIVDGLKTLNAAVTFP